MWGGPSGEGGAKRGLDAGKGGLRAEGRVIERPRAVGGGGVERYGLSKYGVWRILKSWGGGGVK